MLGGEGGMALILRSGVVVVFAYEAEQGTSFLFRISPNGENFHGKVGEPRLREREFPSCLALMFSWPILYQ